MAVIDASQSTKQAKNFVSSLFDFSFTSFITIKLIKAFYLLAMVIAAVLSLMAIAAAFNLNSGAGVLALILSPVVFLLVLTYARVTLELIIVFFQIEAHTKSAALALQPRHFTQPYQA